MSGSGWPAAYRSRSPVVRVQSLVGGLVVVAPVEGLGKGRRENDPGPRARRWGNRRPLPRHPKQPIGGPELAVRSPALVEKPREAQTARQAQRECGEKGRDRDRLPSVAQPFEHPSR